MTTYDPGSVEARWRKRWADNEAYRTPAPQSGQRTFYCLDFFPYPSGKGLSVGHGRNYVPTDVISRYHRMLGEAVLHPMGWDAFGLPAENEAIAKGIHPAVSTARYASHYRRQLDLLGCSYDWSREFSSSDSAYYRWNQYFFLMLYERGLAYRAGAPVNWCEPCQTVLAAEEIEDGACWRCHTQVKRRMHKQWYVRVTAYADELSSALDDLDWPEHILSMQRHWIGRSEGVEIDLPVAGREKSIAVFTTRPDTLFGVTFVVLAPEHPLAVVIAAPERREDVRDYVRRAGQRSELERHTRESDGIFTGAYVALPDGRHAPLFVADYVLAEHGTGAVMGVPAHDGRDFAFARRYDLPVQVVIAPPVWGGAPLEAAYTDAGTLVNSGAFDGMPSGEAAGAITAWLVEAKRGRRAVHYRLRDWLISRQRYWGTPIPIVHCPACGEVPVPAEDLPVELPPLPDYRPRGDGRAPLANVTDFVAVPCPQCGAPAERETDTMTGFVCSSWYYMRFPDPHNGDRPFDPEVVERWLPVDLYVGGAEHAVGHLMYSRFWAKVLADAGMVSFREPFPVLRSQGVLHSRDPETGHPERMSKSKGNVVAPESVIERYGADVTRLHLLFMGPFEANVVWEVEDDGVTPQHIEGVRRFLQRVWRLCEPAAGAPGDVESRAERRLQAETHRTIRAVTEEIERLSFNKAISALMALVNVLEAHRREWGDTAAFTVACSTLLLLLAPFAPFVAEELWGRLGEAHSVHHQVWPTWDPELVREEDVELAVQVDGRVRGHLTVDAAADEAAIREAALQVESVQQVLAGRMVRRVIVVPRRIVNIVSG